MSAATAQWVVPQLLMHGTQAVNFIGKYCYIAAGAEGLAAVTVTEPTEPQAVLGSELHAYAYPDNYKKHCEHGGLLQTAQEHPGQDVLDALKHPFRGANVLQVQARGEYLYAACGAGGLRVFDTAFIADKGFSQRVSSAPVSVGPSGNSSGPSPVKPVGTNRPSWPPRTANLLPASVRSLMPITGP